MILVLQNFWKVLLFSLGSISMFDKNEQELSDNEIIENIKKGKKDYYKQIVDKYGDKIFRYIYYHFLFSKEEVEELTQEVFLKVWQNIDKFQENTNFNAWIYRLTHNLVINHLRKKKINLIEKDIVDLDLSGDFEHDDNIKKELLKTLISRLDTKYKEVLILYYFEEKSYDEIAEIFETTKNTAGSWIKRAKDKLKEIIENDNLLKEALQFDL